MTKLKIKIARGPSDYEIMIGHGGLIRAGRWARTCLGQSAAKIVIVSNPAVFKLYGEGVEKSLGDAGFAVSHFLMKDGEKHKSLKTGEAALAAFSQARLGRMDAVVALGGGVVGDLAGFAAAIYLRGVPFLQIPTTLLSMIDSSVGGKTGVNTTFGKNLTGAIHQPSGVLIDTEMLATLPPSELTAGLCEMVKHGALSGRKLLRQTDQLLGRFSVLNNARDPNLKFEISNLKPTRCNLKSDISDLRLEIENLIAANIAFKAKIVAGDERESSRRIDSRSRKILNLGHTLAHALEKTTNYAYFRHGEAVGYGILFAAELSKKLALCEEKDVKLLNDVVHRVGHLPSLAGIDRQEVLEAFKFDKKNLSGTLQMVLLKGIGKPVIVAENDIPRPLIQKALKQLFKRWT